MARSKYNIRKKAIDIDSSDIRVARDCIRAALSPHLDANLALERANNIAQALMMGGDDVLAIISEMLRNTGIEDIEKLALQVARVWTVATTRV